MSEAMIGKDQRPAFSDNTVFSKTSRYLETDLNNEIVFLDIEEEGFLSLEDTARECWHMIRDGATFGTIVGRLCLIYNVNQDVCRKDIEEFLNELVSCRLVTPNTTKTMALAE